MDSSDLRLSGLMTSGDDCCCDKTAKSAGGKQQDGGGVNLSTFGMNRKKSHEVSRMSQLVAKVMARENLIQV